MKQVQGLFRVVRRHQLVFNRGYGSDITVTIVSLFIGLIIEIMRLILEFLNVKTLVREYLNILTRIFKHSHTPSETREFRLNMLDFSFRKYAFHSFWRKSKIKFCKISNI